MAIFLGFHLQIDLVKMGIFLLPFLKERKLKAEYQHAPTLFLLLETEMFIVFQWNFIDDDVAFALHRNGILTMILHKFLRGLKES